MYMLMYRCVCVHMYVCVGVRCIVNAGSGKSYTMMGSLMDDATKGIIPRLCDTLFDLIAEVCKQWSLWCVM